MPGSFSVSSPGIPRTQSIPIVQSFTEPAAPFEYPSSIIGQTVDANGNPLAGVALKLIRTQDDTVAAQGVSDAGGNYVLGASTALQHKIDAYLAGSPDVAGTTVNTLVGS